MSSSKHMAKNSIKALIGAALAIFGVFMGTVTDRSKRHRSRERTIIDKKGLARNILKNTARTIDDIKYDIEKSVMDYKSAPEKHIIETDEDIIVHLDMPGVKKEDIELKITEKELKVNASFDITHETGNENNVTINDRKTGVFKRSVQFPKKVMPEKAEATLENGVLTVEAPKVDRKESFEVKIK